MNRYAAYAAYADGDGEPHTFDTFTEALDYIDTTGAGTVYDCATGREAYTLYADSGAYEPHELGTGAQCEQDTHPTTAGPR